MKGKVTIIHWTDPDYLDEFYKAWGSGQSITSRQASPVRPEDQSSRCRVVEDDGDLVSKESTEE